ncbi:MAG TPA: PQQ-binding-like beta-propeller repeat protein [Terriglobia bacterium]|nr:PQQ-binding-like beta-propeller repeat protein [Terriglobia bacterium]
MMKRKLRWTALPCLLVAFLAFVARAAQSPETAAAPRLAAEPWPSFRGTAAAGTADGQGAVAEWDVPSGRNIRWTVPLAGFANSSPIIWGNRVILTSAVSGAGDATFSANTISNVRSANDMSEQTLQLMGLDTATGNVVWERDVYKGAPRTKRHPKSSHAAGTPATDGRHIVAMYGTSGILAGYDMSGNPLWKNDLGVIDSGYVPDPTAQWGHSSSPIIYQNTVIAQVDQQKNSFIAAYDLDTGKEVWKTARDGEVSTWGTPTVFRGKTGDELITNGTTIRSYDPKTGRLRWSLGPNSQITIPTPIAGPDIIYVMGGYTPVRPIYAVRPGFTGDISLKAGATSSDAIAWSNDRDGVYIPTPILYRGLLYAVNNTGILTAYDALTGERAFRSRVGTGSAVSASPIAADGRLYFANEDGEVFVIRAGRTYEEITRNAMPDPITATPAISDGLLVIRTIRSVYGIGSK